jgi:hypothetical protein
LVIPDGRPAGAAFVLRLVGFDALFRALTATLAVFFFLPVDFLTARFSTALAVGFGVIFDLALFFANVHNPLPTTNYP